jgi:hypothetical protein
MTMAWFSMIGVGMRILAVGTVTFDVIGWTNSDFHEDSLTVPLTSLALTHGGRGANFTAVVSSAVERRADIRLPADRAARIGSVVASFVIESAGCRSGIPTSAQVTRRSEAFYPSRDVNGVMDGLDRRDHAS